MLVEIRNQDNTASVWVNPLNPALLVLIPSPLSPDQKVQISTGGTILIQTSEAEARKLLAAANA